jgi:predicted membrane-bound dolichyl-phosphate-mannose-protein mannosyltransferase
MKKILFPFLLIISFLIMKFSNNGIRLSDTNTYFNIAYQMSHGKILYKDIFFSNFPFFSYLSYFYYFLSGKNINLFYFTSEIEVALITLLIYFISYRKTKDYIVSITASLLYILSFMVLSTSDHQTGVFTACLFAVLSYYFLQEKKFIISGIFIALSVSTKAYFLPVFLSIFTFIALKKKWSDLFKLCLAGVITGIITLLPALIQAPKQLISDIFGFSLTRPVGLVKTDILWFFINERFSAFYSSYIQYF